MLFLIHAQGVLESSGALRAPSILCAASPRLESAAQMAVTMSLSNLPSSLLRRQKRAYHRQSDRIGHFLFVMFSQNFCRCPPLFLALVCLYMCARVRMCGHEIKVRGWRGCAGDRVVSVACARAQAAGRAARWGPDRQAVIQTIHGHTARSSPRGAHECCAPHCNSEMTGPACWGCLCMCV